MPAADETFRTLVGQILERFCRQNDREPPAFGELQGLADRLWEIVAERGLPPPLRVEELGTPTELSNEACAPLLARVMEKVREEDRIFFANPVRQLVKACFHGEFKICRDSFREVSPDGACRRQQLARARQRISGTHCIDCPYWVTLTSEQHARFLEKQWQPTGVTELVLHRSIFLPEDFRELRRYLHTAARARI